MTEDGKIKLDPLIKRRVIFKLKKCNETMDAKILGFDETGYWIEGGTLAAYLPTGDDKTKAVRFLEFHRIAWIQAAPD